MAARYWVGGGSSSVWNAITPTNWALTSGGANNASVPTSTDDVFFDANSGIAANTWPAAFDIATFDCLGYAGTINFASSSTRNITGNGGVFRLSSAMSLVAAGFCTVVFTGTSGTMLVTCAGKSGPNNGLNFVNINGVGLTVQCQDAFYCSGNLTLTAGTFDANNFNVSIINSFSTTGSLTRALLMGSGQWSVAINASSQAFNVSTVTGLTFNAGTSKLTFPLIGVGGSTTMGGFTAGGVTYYDVEIYGLTGDVRQFNLLGGGTFRNLTFRGPNLWVNLGGAATYTVTSLAFLDTGPTSIIGLGNFTVGASSVTFTQASGTVTADWVALGNFAATGGATFNATHAFDLGGLTGWTITPPLASQFIIATKYTDTVESFGVAVMGQALLATKYTLVNSFGVPTLKLAVVARIVHSVPGLIGTYASGTFGEYSFDQTNFYFTAITPAAGPVNYDFITFSGARVVSPTKVDPRQAMIGSSYFVDEVSTKQAITISMFVTPALGYGTPPPPQYRMATAWDVNDVQFDANGRIGLHDPSAPLPTYGELQLGSLGYGISGPLTRVRYWPRRLSDAELLVVASFPAINIDAVNFVNVNTFGVAVVGRADMTVPAVRFVDDVESFGVPFVELINKVLRPTIFIDDVEFYGVPNFIVYEIATVPPDFVGEGPPPPPPELVTQIPDIAFAHYQSDGLVRIHYTTNTETTVSEADVISPVGVHLHEWLALGNTIAPYTLTVTPNDVDLERTRRIEKGVLITLDDGRLIALNTHTYTDFINVNYLTTTAGNFKLPASRGGPRSLRGGPSPFLSRNDPRYPRFAMGIGIDPRVGTTEDLIVIRDAYNLDQILTLDDMIEIGAKVTGTIQSYYNAAYLLKDSTTIPLDYTDDSYWPDFSYPAIPPSGYTGFPQELTLVNAWMLADNSGLIRANYMLQPSGSELAAIAIVASRQYMAGSDYFTDEMTTNPAGWLWADGGTVIGVETP